MILENMNKEILKNLIEYAIKTSKPLMGICRGMQMIAKYFDVFLDPIDNHVSKKINIWFY